MAPHVAKTLAAQTTAVVEPTAETMEPMHKDRMNWAKNTMDDTMATSVPRPRTWGSAPSYRTPELLPSC